MSIGSTITFEHSSKTVIRGNTAAMGGGIYLKLSILYVFGDIQVVENVAEKAGGGIRAIIVESNLEKIYVTVLN